MSLPLKKACEIAIARELAKVPGLRAITPKIWDDNATVRLPHLNIQGNPTGESLAYPHPIFQVDLSVRVEGKPRKGYTVASYIALVDAVFAEIALLDADALAARFAGSGVFVHGTIPRQLPATIEGDNRVDMAGVSLIAHLAC